MNRRRVFHEREASILAIGADGPLGSALIGELLARRHSVRALVRPGDFRASLVPPIEVAVGELSDPASLDRAMEGVDRLFLLTRPGPDEVRLGRAAIEAARRAGVKLIVRSSLLGANPCSAATVLRHHGTSDRQLQSAGIPCVILRPNQFLQTIIEETIPSIDADGRFFLNAGTARISMVDARDVGLVAAVVLSEPGHEGRIYDLTGPEALSYSEIARRLTRSIGWPTSYADATDEAIRARLIERGADPWLATTTVELFEEYRLSGPLGNAAAITDKVELLTGTPARTLDALISQWLPQSPPEQPPSAA